ncbi:hypothetical protein L6452_16228 [Arctium lappa]|uniref:Uncharacterized protein n=1 Tax=Arctium lappa TaxID=4217 RepID=A0ACB9C050_ARCLA|nr:hypothetical protein L6452_16228 [Arctium lappa]
MDRATTERCTKNTERVRFARVLVEVSAEDSLMEVVAVKYPQRKGDQIRPGTEEEVAANLLKDALRRSNVAGVGIVDGFQVVGRWNRVVSNQCDHGNGLQGRNVQGASTGKVRQQGGMLGVKEGSSSGVKVVQQGVDSLKDKDVLVALAHPVKKNDNVS